MSHLIAPSILAADFANLERDIRMLDESDADWIHIDVMDGIFVPNISFGLPVIKAIRQYTRKPFDCHLMIEDAGPYLQDFKDAGADMITVHVEAEKHMHRTLHAIKDLGMRAGISINPGTPVHMLKEVVRYADLILIMSVNPGFGGQKFIPESVNKVERTRQLIKSHGSEAMIQVDGGVNADNARTLIDAGANCLVAGSFVFKSEDPKQTISNLKSV